MNNDYGDELNDIGIISIIMPEEDHLFYPERRLFQRKQKSADIRLWINYKEFILAKPEKRMEMYANHILLSVKTLEKKVSKQYRFKELMQDLKSLLPESTIEV